MAKKKDNWLENLSAAITLRGILFNPATLVILVSAATIAGTIYLWNQHQTAIVDLEDYVLTADKVAISKLQPPGTPDLRVLVAAPASGEQPNSLLDPQLVNQTVERIKRVGWIESIHNITKSKSGLNIDLDYRNSIGVVELNRSNVRAWPDNRAELLIPIDRAGVIMPQELASRSLFRITVFEPQIPISPEPWSAVSDDRILGSVAIHEYLSQRWEAFGFYRITTLRPPAQPSDSFIPFQIWTNTKSIATKVIWGNPPGQEIPGEAPASRKLQVLEEMFAQYGPLNQLPPSIIDLRSGTPITSQHKTAEIILSGGSLIK